MTLHDRMADFADPGVLNQRGEGGTASIREKRYQRIPHLHADRPQQRGHVRERSVEIDEYVIAVYRTFRRVTTGGNNGKRRTGTFVHGCY